MFEDALLNTNYLLSQTKKQQVLASSPKISAWVSANAGAGKTHVLKLRVLRLLLAETLPERILCLTYTKAAAAEMSQRIFNDLAEWATARADNLREKLSKLLDRDPTEHEVNLSRQLFARTIDAPGGLKVLTIHAFCERLLQCFPLEAGVPPGFTILDSDQAFVFRREAITTTLREAYAAPNSKLGQALKSVVARATDENFDQVLVELLQCRQWIEDMKDLSYRSGDSTPFESVRKAYCEIFAVHDDTTHKGLIHKQANVLNITDLQAAANILLKGGKRDVELAGLLSKAAESMGKERISYLRKAFFTTSGRPRSDKQFISKSVRVANKCMAEQLTHARNNLHTLTQEMLGLETVDATLALMCLGSRILHHYDDAKTQRAALDFEDLITKSASLLMENNSANWVLYKLDGGVDHILVDEAQDTSATQWKIINALATEFFTGENLNNSVRSIFAVGDEKQSIYSFQGAVPERFADMGKLFSKQVRDVGQIWKHIPLTLSFRTVKPLLDAVDAIFSNKKRTPGMNLSGMNIYHQALRNSDAGCFEIWPIIKSEPPKNVLPFHPLEDLTPDAPADVLARKIAKHIKNWLKNGEILQSQGRPVHPADILILVRRRQPFGPKIVRALKNLCIPVAGADRIALTDQLAIQDLLALADFILLPEDDLALASTLKSPLFKFDDDDLLLFAPQRKTSLWSALLAHVDRKESQNERFIYAIEKLERWKAFANFIPPYEFFSKILDHEGGRAQLIGRLGPDSADSIDEFMNLALTFDQSAPASLQGFVHWFRDSMREIKRDMEQTRDEVRVMTVHSAKGLESPIVFLPDTCTAPGGGLQSSLVDLIGFEIHQQQKAAPKAWAIKGSRALQPIANGLAKITSREEEEHNRLLYVALTRARDRVYIAGYENKNRRSKQCWYDTIWDGLQDNLCLKHDVGGDKVWRIESTQTQEVLVKSQINSTEVPVVQLPAWALCKAPQASQPTVLFSQSCLESSETNPEMKTSIFAEKKSQEYRLAETLFTSPLNKELESRFLRGRLIHTLLNNLQMYSHEEYHGIAEQYIHMYGKSLGTQTRASIIEEVLNVITDPICSSAFEREAQTDVSIIADLISPFPNDPPLKVSGKIDRLVKTSDGILIIDFKSNRYPPETLNKVNPTYLMKLAAYSLAIRNIYPSVSVRAALIWTFRPTVMEVPDHILHNNEYRLWSQHKSNLDAH
ncbi:MAG TPA: ATP-dependent helicase/nuclease subunit A [Hyphomicrobiaceae bacterium MAG_BT-2024]